MSYDYTPPTNAVSSAPKRPSLIKRFTAWLMSFFRRNPLGYKQPWGNRVFNSKITVRIHNVIRLTSLKHHAWVESNVGIIKKELKNIPDSLLQEFYARQLS